MGDGDNLNNVLSQDEIDKLAGLGDDKKDELKEESIDISSMLSQDEIDEVAGNLNDLNEQNPMDNSLSQEEIDNLSGLTKKSEPVTVSPEQSMLSQEEIDKLSENESEEKKKEKSLNEENKSEKKENSIDVAGDSSSERKVFKEIEGEENSNLDKDKEIGENIDEAKISKRKMLIPGSIAAVIVLLVCVYFIIGHFFADGPEIVKEEKVEKEKVLPDKKKKIKKKEDLKTNESQFVKEQKNKEIFKKNMTLKTINKAVELFFITYEQRGIEEIIIKSEELIVAHDMDISERNLQLCLSFDLTASLIDTTVSKKNNKKPNEYFQLLKLNKRYKKRLMNLGYSNEEADALILNWGKKTIDILKEKIKLKPELLENKK